jgi:hypothetical protein
MLPLIVLTRRSLLEWLLCALCLWSMVKLARVGLLRYRSGTYLAIYLI